jgi:hypothetical protein
MKTTKKDVRILFERVCESYNLPMTAVCKYNNPKQREFYSNNFYKLDYNSCYGGYSFRIVQTSTSERSAFNAGDGRYSTKEAYLFLLGLLNAQTLLAGSKSVKL